MDELGEEDFSNILEELNKALNKVEKEGEFNKKRKEYYKTSKAQLGLLKFMDNFVGDEKTKAQIDITNNVINYNYLLTKLTDKYLEDAEKTNQLSGLILQFTEILKDFEKENE